MASEPERIATLEAQGLEASRQRTAINDKLDHQDAELAAIRSDVSAIRTQLASYRGFIGGAVFVVTLLGGAVGALAAALWHRAFGGQ